ncbi:MerR-like DNA binding protein [Arthrobacter sp. AG1021]|uniref:MerR family transcriptional regulator n=1 Tax=Arthrobacter sp. AG1021 TaxID=2183908 RepID=UPI000EADD1CE|nr:MerR family transcriptional regulator [Arthrobacter sp. AG1021]RKS16288.1 MerR-like DNA binding protein [Arthrobacter sp. AG1021]
MSKNSAHPEGASRTHSIATAAQSVGVSVQTVRLYEVRGLITPARTSGGTRRYHAEDLARLKQISDLIERGVNLAGIGIILELEAENDGLRQELAARPQRESGE